MLVFKALSKCSGREFRDTNGRSRGRTLPGRRRRRDGNAFPRTPEANAHPVCKAALVAASEEDTVRQKF
jgi:hypothetical protein